MQNRSEMRKNHIRHQQKQTHKASAIYKLERKLAHHSLSLQSVAKIDDGKEANNSMICINTLIHTLRDVHLKLFETIAQAEHC